MQRQTKYHENQETQTTEIARWRGGDGKPQDALKVGDIDYEKSQDSEGVMVSLRCAKGRRYRLRKIPGFRVARGGMSNSVRGIGADVAALDRAATSRFDYNLVVAVSVQGTYHSFYRGLPDSHITVFR